MESLRDVTFCFTDVVGSTRLLRSLGEQAYTEVLERYRSIVREALAAVGGEEVKTEGDGFFLAFPDPEAAVAFAVATQRGVGAERWPAGAVLRARIGLHAGPAERRGDGDYIAMAVHQASRVEAAAQPEQILLTSTLRSAPVPAGCHIVTLGRHRLRDFDEPVELLQVVGPGLVSVHLPVRAAREDHGLPLPRTPLVGRDDELIAVARQLESARCLTLVGPGGVGKTRLALEAAALVAAAHPGGIHLVELSPVAGPDLVAGAVATAVDARPGAGEEVIQGIVARFAAGRHLLVLDSCERVLDGVAPLVETLLRRCPGVVILATSTEAIRIPDEQVMPLGPLHVPETDDHVDRAAASPAVVLLEQRAAAAGSPPLLDEEVPALAAIARTVDGIPLALELAGARIADLGVAGVVEGLSDRFSLLTGGFRTALPRHRALSETVAWSVDLLEPADRSLLAQLSVLLGKWDPAAALEVCGRPQDHAALQRLVDRSLVVMSLDDAPRLRLLDTIRAFMGAELAPDERSDVQRRRLHSLAEIIAACRLRPEATIVLSIGDLIADIRYATDPRTAHDWSIAAELLSGSMMWFEYSGLWQEGVELAERLETADLAPPALAHVRAARLPLLWLLGRAQEAATLAELVVDEPASPTIARVVALMHQFVPDDLTHGSDPLEEAEALAGETKGPLILAIRTRKALRSVAAGEIDTAIALLTGIIEAADQQGYHLHSVQALINRGGILLRSGRIDEGAHDLEVGRQRALAIEQRALAWAAVTGLAMVALHRQQYAHALALAEERLAAADAVDDERGAGPALTVIQVAALASGDPARALAAGERLVAMSQGAGDVVTSVVGAFNLVLMADRTGDSATAHRWATAALSFARSSSSPMASGLALLAVGGLACRAGDGDGMVLLGAAATVQVDNALDPSDREWRTEAEEVAAKTLGAEATESLRRRGEALTTDEAFVLADAVVERLTPVEIDAASAHQVAEAVEGKSGQGTHDRAVDANELQVATE